jgi:CTP:molybdopterin cytidylyltransferase MocA
VEAIVLAAGRARRMGGRPKHLIPIEGLPMLERVLRRLAAARLAAVTVVLRSGDAPGAEIARRCGARAAAVAPEACGRAASVRTGVGATSADAAALLVALADQPHLTTADFDALIAAFETGTAGIVHASYAGERGTPVLFARRYRDALLALRGTQGGREVLLRHPEDARAVPLPPERGRDLDRPEDLAPSR